MTTLYREIDALGGTHNSDFLRGYVGAIDVVLAILLKRGFTEQADATPPLYEDAMALIAKMAAGNDMDIDHYDEAKHIHDAVTPVDPDLLLAREIVKETLQPEDHARCNCRDRIDEGLWDSGHKIRAALAAIKRGRELAEKSLPR